MSTQTLEMTIDHDVKAGDLVVNADGVAGFAAKSVAAGTPFPAITTGKYALSLPMTAPDAPPEIGDNVFLDAGVLNLSAGTPVMKIVSEPSADADHKASFIAKLNAR